MAKDYLVYEVYKGEVVCLFESFSLIRKTAFTLLL